MKLTPENLDSMDARPINRETGVAKSARIEALIAARTAKLSGQVPEQRPKTDARQPGAK